MMKLKTLFLLTILGTSSVFAETAIAEQLTQPKVYSYWAGWSNADIPNFSFNGLFLSFALLKNDGNGNYYSDYSASGNFQKPASTGAYASWNNWTHTFYKSGARAYVSYGGATNGELRGEIIKADNNQLSKMAGELKANIKLFYFDGIDLDIENWWSFNKEENIKFARNLATMIKMLRTSLDSDPATAGKEIMITVGDNAAGLITGISDGGSTYTGTMQAFFSDADAMNAVSDINIMSYNTCIANFYSRQDLIGGLLKVFSDAGIPKQKIMFGIQPYECVGRPPATPIETIVSLGQFIKANNYGGLFLWGIGTEGIGKLSSWDYVNAMKSGLGLK